MRKYLFLFTFLLLSAKSFAQDKDFNYKFYGQIRTDFYYNSRANEETVDGLFYICLLYTSPSPRDGATSRMPSSA